jgi:hypothetical protein
MLGSTIDQCKTTFTLTCGYVRTIISATTQACMLFSQGLSQSVATHRCFAKRLTVRLLTPVENPWRRYASFYGSGIRVENTRKDVDLYASDPCPGFLDMTGHRCGAGRADIGSS